MEAEVLLGRDYCLNSPRLVEAVQLWTGWGQSTIPNRNDMRAVDYFGEEISAKVLALMKSRENDFNASDAQLVAANLQEMEELASKYLKRKHLRVADDTARAFAWCYTFEFK